MGIFHIFHEKNEKNQDFSQEKIEFNQEWDNINRWVKQQAPIGRSPLTEAMGSMVPTF